MSYSVYLVACKSDIPSRQALEKKRYTALEKWTEALEGVHAAVINKAPGTARSPGEHAIENFGPGSFDIDRRLGRPW